MSKNICVCQCPHCQQENEQQRRWYVAVESHRLGHGGIELMSQITGMDPKTIWRGRREMAAELEGRPNNRTRLKGRGRLLFLPLFHRENLQLKYAD